MRRVIAAAILTSTDALNEAALRAPRARGSREREARRRRVVARLDVRALGGGGVRVDRML
jgi:hypothetical protein